MSKFNEVIKSYLDKRAKEDPLFAETYKKKNKSIEECCQYIYSRARKVAKGGNAVGIDDATVYGWAVHYYDEDNIKVDNVKEGVEVSTPDSVKEEVVVKMPEKPVKKNIERKKTKQELFDERQLSLFDF